MDCAATEYFRDGKYEMKGEELSLTPDENVAYLQELVSDYPIFSIEDGASEDDWDGWATMTEVLGETTQLVGDDRFCKPTPNGWHRGLMRRPPTRCWLK